MKTKSYTQLLARFACIVILAGCMVSEGMAQCSFASYATQSAGVDGVVMEDMIPIDAATGTQGFGVVGASNTVMDWWPFYAEVGQTYSFSTCNASTYDTQITILNPDGTQATPGVGCSSFNNDDIACAGNSSMLTFCPITTGYYIVLVTEFNCNAGEAGDLATLTWNFSTAQTPQANDVPCGAIAIPTASISNSDVNHFANPVCGNNELATFDGPFPSCHAQGAGGNVPVYGDVWYSVTVPDNGVLNITLQSNEPSGGAFNADMELVVYSGACASPTEEFCNDDADGTGFLAASNNSEININAGCGLAGQTILIQVIQLSESTFGAAIADGSHPQEFCLHLSTPNTFCSTVSNPNPVTPGVNCTSANCNVNVLPANTTNPAFTADYALSSNTKQLVCPQGVATAVSNSVEYCFDYTHLEMGSTSAEIFLGISLLEEGDLNGTNDCGGAVFDLVVYENGNCGTPFAMNTQTLTGLTVGNTYTICVSAEAYNVDEGTDGIPGTADDGPIAEGTCSLEGLWAAISPLRCIEYSAISVGAICNIFQVCIGYTIASGLDPTGMTMTVDFGTAVGGTFIDDGLFSFDTDGLPGPDAVGYCVTYLFDEQSCTPRTYPGTVTVTCPDGVTPATLDVGQAGAPTSLTAADVACDVFAICSGGAFYPALTGPTTTNTGCGGMLSWSVLAPDASVCSTNVMAVPCSEGASANLNENVQTNGISDPLLSSFFGAGSFTCGVDQLVDITATCPSCGAGEMFDMATCACVMQPVPIELLYFEGVAEAKYNRLFWATASEINNEWQIIERSGNGIEQWKEIGRVAARGSAHARQDYEWQDHHPMAKAYYRLRSVDYDGFTSYSDVVFLQRSEAGRYRHLIDYHPNPADDVLHLTLQSDAVAHVHIRITDVMGQLVYRSVQTKEAGISQTTVDVSGLTPGLYLVAIGNETDTEVIRVVVE